MELVSTYFWIPFVVAAAWGVYVYFFPTERLPNVEFIRICDKPGKAGNADDVQAFLDDSLSAIMKGYNRYSKLGKHFLLRTPKQVYMIVAPRFIEEIRKAPETHLSQPAAANIIFQIRHNFHPALETDQYHYDVVKLKLTKALEYNIPILVDESQWAFRVEMGDQSGWTEMNMHHFATNVVTRVVNRILVGPELCRNDEFLQFSGTVTATTFSSAVKLRNYPEFIKPVLIYFMKDRKLQQQTAHKFLIPIIKKRLEILEKAENAEKNQGTEIGKPVDALQWLLDITPPNKRDPDILVQRMISLNVNAIHPPTVTWMEVMYDLCRHPEIHEELRNEIAEVLGKPAGDLVWQKANVDRLIKLDSFIRESTRLTPMSAIKLERLAVKDFSFSDGTLVPAGTSIGIIAHGRHIDEDILPNATTFDPFRYARARAEPGMENQFTFAQASQDNLLFGLGRHACPGRHFASVLLKVLLVRTLVQYDIKFVEGNPLPQGKWTQKFRNPDETASIAWRPRAAEDRFAGIF